MLSSAQVSVNGYSDHVCREYKVMSCVSVLHVLEIRPPPESHVTVDKVSHLTEARVAEKEKEKKI
jgi:hypothetical protein